MRYIATALVVVMVVLAGCNTGGAGGTPTAETTGNGTENGTMTANGTTTEMSTQTPGSGMSTPTNDTSGDEPSTNDTAGNESSTNDTTQSGVDASAVPGVEGSQMTNNTALLVAWVDSITTGHTDFETTFEGNSEVTGLSGDRFDYQFRNDTSQQLYVVNTTDRPATYYIDGDDAAIRNDSSGEVRYSNETNYVGQGTAFLNYYAFISLNYAYVLDWNATDTTTVDDEEHYVLEATGFNETALEQSSLNKENITSPEGRLVVGSDGVVHSGTVDIAGKADINVTYSLQTDDSIDVTAPDWYDESQHN